MLELVEVRIIVGSHFKHCAVPTLSSDSDYSEAIVPSRDWGMNRGAFSIYLSCVIGRIRAEGRFSEIPKIQNFRKGPRDTRDYLNRPLSRLADRYAIRIYGMQL